MIGGALMWREVTVGVIGASATRSVRRPLRECRCPQLWRRWPGRRLARRRHRRQGPRLGTRRWFARRFIGWP